MSGNQKGSASETTLHQKGMSKKSAEPSDASTRCKGGSVNDESTRKEVAETPTPIGGRCA